MKFHFISVVVVDEDVSWYKPVLHDVSGSYQSMAIVIKRWWWWSLSGGGLVVIEWWWPLSLSEVVGFAAEWVVVVVFGWFGCMLVVVGEMLEVVMAVGWVVRGHWLHFHSSCLFGGGS